ncbi:hypothetical protein QG516_23375 [Pedobacter gandavensis]|uniref:hypothetical protein n=1 Tax=Pedobacter TaxID=84567 RepID=UPI001C991344|nr:MULTISPECIES: hypothetical protein [Pedobacter]WGQ09460.1 hypothetical protein QG516_23375 [Pedobacter gandavensis]
MDPSAAGQHQLELNKDKMVKTPGALAEIQLLNETEKTIPEPFNHRNHWYSP